MIKSIKSIKTAFKPSSSDQQNGGDDVKVEKRQKGPKMSRDHFEKGRMRQNCNGCQRQITLVFKRHHCRMCGKIFCETCSPFKRRLSADTTPNPDGDLHRVCLYCIEDGDDGVIGSVRSLTEEFMNMRQEAHARKSPIEKAPELKLSCEIPQVCQPVVDLFLADITEIKDSFMKTKLRDSVMRAKRNSDCTTCDRSLYLPGERKKCVICDDIFCSNCSSKNLIVYYPRGAVPQTEIEQGKVQPTMDVIAPGADMTTITELWRNYRTCSACGKHLEHVLGVFHFNSRLQDRHHELMDLEGQILATLDRAQGNKLRRSAAMDNLDQVLEGGFDGFPHSQSDVFGNPSKSEAMIVDERVTQKLFNRYWVISNFVRTQLKPVTQTQERLHSRVLAATTSFYVDKKFRVRYDSNNSTTSADD